MPSFQKRGTGWRVQVRKQGITKTATFDTKAEGERWAAVVEGEIAGRRMRLDVPDMHMREALQRYLAEVTPLKKSAAMETIRIQKWLDDPLTNRKLGDLTPAMLTAWRNKRLKSVAPATARLELAILSNLYTVAAREWHLLIPSPFAAFRLPAKAKARDRRLQGDEEQRILSQCSPDLADIVVLAIETAMRQSEILGIKDGDRRGDVLLLSDTKNGESRSVPLTGKARQIIESREGKGGRSSCSLPQGLIVASYRGTHHLRPIARYLLKTSLGHLWGGHWMPKRHSPGCT